MKAVVIGAGVIGLCSAYELSRRGCSVTIVDKGEPGAACSSGNAGWLVPSLAGPLPAPGLVARSLKWMLGRDSPLYIKPGIQIDLAKWLWQFRRYCNEGDYRRGLEAVASFGQETMALFDALKADGVEFEMNHAGVLLAFLSMTAMKDVLSDLEVMRHYGYQSPQVFSGQSLLELEPALSQKVAGGVLVEEERHLRPETFTAGMVKRLTAMGTRILQGVEITGAHRRGRAISAVATIGGELEADVFLIAAGAWSGSLAGKFGFYVPVQAGKGYSITVHRPALQLRRPLYLDEAKIACTPFNGALRFAGTMELSGINTILDRRRLIAMGRAADTYLPGWSRGEAQDEWVGMRPVTPDGLPIIGRVPGYDNLYIATGHAILGVTLAPATALAIAECVCSGTTRSGLKPFDPGRFGPRLDLSSRAVGAR